MHRALDGLLRMTHADWLLFAEFLVGVFVIFYINIWFLESGQAGSWKAGHKRLWKKPKKWQFITFCILWGFIVIGFVVAYQMRNK